jgi:molybdopterin converting factor small subunit
MAKKSKLLISIIALAFLSAAIGFAVWHKGQKSAPENQNQAQETQKKYYEALVMVRDQKMDDPVADKKYSLKAGDVIAFFPAGTSGRRRKKSVISF